MKKILIIDDDPEIRSVLSEMLAGSFQPLEASGGKEGLQLAVREQPTLILLDVNMPEMRGFEVCKRIREQPAIRHIPVIMLSTQSDLDSRVEGLSLGADDYITKPFVARDLLARIQARLRREQLEAQKTQEMVSANLTLKPESLQVWVDGEELRLTRVEFDLLRYFLERPDQLIDRNALLADLWPDAVVTLRTVDTHVANLRKKLKGYACAIKSVYGSGYILKTK